MMKKLFKKITAIGVCMVTALAFAACGNTEENSAPVVDEGSLKDTYGDRAGQTLEVSVLDKGVGVDWIKDAARNFNAGTGSNIAIKADSSLNESLETFISARSGSDVYFSFSAQHQWVRWGLQGKIYPLDDLGISFNETMEVVGVIDGVRYTMPYNYAPTGFVYNADYIAEIPSNGEFTKGEFPSTWQGLLDMCDSVNENWKKSVRGQQVVPMSWGGSVGDMGYVFEALWGQIDPVGYKAYWNQETESVTGQKNKSLLVNDGSVQAMDCVAKLLNAKENAKGNYYPSNSFADSTSHSNLMAEQKFLNGLSVFTISGSWFENEMREQIEEEELDFYHFATMPTVNDGGKETIYVNSPAEYFIIATNGKNDNPDLAKAFLKYLATEERSRVFQAYTGVPTAMKYKMQKDSLSNFAKEVAEALERSEQVVSVSDKKPSLSGALNLNVTTPFIKLATTQYTSSSALSIMEELYTNQYNGWKDYFKTFD